MSFIKKLEDTLTECANYLQNVQRSNECIIAPDTLSTVCISLTKDIDDGKYDDDLKAYYTDIDELIRSYEANRGLYSVGISKCLIDSIINRTKTFIPYAKEKDLSVKIDEAMGVFDKYLLHYPYIGNVLYLVEEPCKELSSDIKKKKYDNDIINNFKKIKERLMFEEKILLRHKHYNVIKHIIDDLNHSINSRIEVFINHNNRFWDK